LETVLRTNFKEVATRVGYRPGEDAGDIGVPGGMALISLGIDMEQLDIIIEEPGGMIGHLPGCVKKSAALISSL